MIKEFQVAAFAKSLATPDRLSSEFGGDVVKHGVTFMWTPLTSTGGEWLYVDRDDEWQFVPRDHR